VRGFEDPEYIAKRYERCTESVRFKSSRAHMLLSNQILILYEDENLLVISKPAGLVVHSDGKTKEQSVSDWVLQNYPQVKGVGEPLKLSNGALIERHGIVHRLDRETSGALIIAKNQSIFLFLKKQFQESKIEKTYHAFVYGDLKEDKGVIEKPIARSKKDFRQWSAGDGRRGKERRALTEYKVLERNDNSTFVEVKPKTGRTHQIRVHFKAINHPILCDKLYAPKRECLLGFNRLALHARRLILKTPDDKTLDIEASYPEDFNIALKDLKIKN